MRQGQGSQDKVALAAGYFANGYKKAFKDLSLPEQEAAVKSVLQKQNVTSIAGKFGDETEGYVSFFIKELKGSVDQTKPVLLRLLKQKIAEAVAQVAKDKEGPAVQAEEGMPKLEDGASADKGTAGDAPAPKPAEAPKSNEKDAPKVNKSAAPAKRTFCGKACGVLGAVVKAGCKLVYSGMAVMAFECLTKVSLGLTSALSSFLQTQSLAHYAYAYDMRASTAMHSASVWLIDPNKQTERMAVSAAVVVIGATALAAKYCCSSRSKVVKPVEEVVATVSH